MAKAVGQVGPQPGLNVVGGRKVAVAPFGGTGQIALARPDQKRLAESRAWRQHRDGRVRDGVACVDRDGFRWQQMRRRVGNGLQVIEQRHLLEIEFAGERRLVEVPRQIRQVRATPAHRTGDVEAGRTGFATRLGQKGRDDRRESGEVRTLEFLLREEFTGAGFLG